MKKTFVTLLTACLLTACAPTSFQGSEYQLADAPITLGFSDKDNRFFGQAVNRYFGHYTLSETNGITFSPIGATMMMGPETDMRRERAYLIDLERVSFYRLEKNRLILVLSDGQELVFDRVGKASD